MGPLAGYTILDISTVMAAPFGTSVLADHGADVIKIEAPGGDIMRNSGASPEPGMSPIFQHMNRNKRSMVLDLKAPAGRETLLRLARDADAVIYNMRPAALERLGLGYDAFREANPKIVHCGVIGYGQGGRYEARPAYDDLIQGASAVPQLFGRATQGPPRFVPFGMMDRMVGLYVALSVAMALLRRGQTGEGSEIVIPMFEAATHFVLVEHMFGASFDPPVGSAINKRMMEPDRRPFPTKDGYICALPYIDRHWRELSRIFGIDDLTLDPRFADFPSRRENITELYALLAEQLTTRTTDEWLALLDEADIPAVACPTVEELLEDPHLQDRGFYKKMPMPGGTFTHMASPVEWGDWEHPDPRPAPRLSEHAVVVLREAGFSDEEIDGLLADGITTDGVVPAS